MPAKRIFLETESREIRKRYLAGETVKAIAKKFAAAEATISRHLKEIGLQVGVPEISDKDLDRIKALYAEEGFTLDEISSRYPWGRHRIRDALNAAGLRTDKTVTEDEHKLRLAVHGKVELLGVWVDTRTSTTYKCIEHGEVHPALPLNVERGHGLKCCLREIRGKAQNQVAKIEFDAKLKSRWGKKIVRIGEYIDSKTPILFECSEHGESHLASPGNVLYFGGLMCCKIASLTSKAEPKRLEAKARYDEEIAKKGKVVRIGEYVTALTPILHRCLVHNEVHFATPNKCLIKNKNWGGLFCCRGSGGGDTVEAALKDQFQFGVDEDTYFYVFSMENSPEHVKPGIAKDLRARADQEYGDLESAWLHSSRHEAFFVEQVVLRETSKWADFPDELSEWSGKTELRRIHPDQLMEIAEYFNQKMYELGRWQFALEFLDLPPYLLELCQARLDGGRPQPQS